MNCSNQQQIGYGQPQAVNYMRGRGQAHGFRNRRAGGPFGQQFAEGPFRVPVNVEETPTTFEVYVAAPGRTKEEFSVQVKDDVLTIAYQLPQVTGEVKAPNWRQQEFSKGEFARSFNLNGKVDASNISASYLDGILQVTLPKSPKADQPAQDVTIA